MTEISRERCVQPIVEHLTFIRKPAQAATFKAMAIGQE
jgi:hypothetical protein